MKYTMAGSGRSSTLIVLSVLCLHNIKDFILGTALANMSRPLSQCVCPGQTLILECTVTGGPGGATVWSGTAFDCLGSEITLFHDSNSGAIGECNNGAIVGQKISVESNVYTSQLNVTISHNMNGKTIMCAYDDMTSNSIIIELSTIIVIPDTNVIPNKLFVSNVDFVSRRFIFTWSLTSPECQPIVQYNILALHCGRCPTTTNHTTVTCTDIQLNGSECAFAVQPVVCGDIHSSVSEPITIDINSTSLCTENNTIYIIFITFLTIALISSVVVSVTVTVLSKKNKAKSRNNFQLATGRGKVKSPIDTMYETVHVMTPSAPATAISTQENVAYGHAQD